LHQILLINDKLKFGSLILTVTGIANQPYLAGCFATSLQQLGQIIRPAERWLPVE
jgi:hypothetical protein